MASQGLSGRHRPHPARGRVPRVLIPPSARDEDGSV